MKPRTKILMILIGITVAMITAIISVAQNNRMVKEDELRNINKCFTEHDIDFLMWTTNSSRSQSMKLLEMACDRAITP